MLSNEVNVHFMLKELFSSIRETNRRMDELKIMYKQPFCKDEMKDFIKDRLYRLHSTKFCLIFSIYDLRMQVINTFSHESEGDIKMREIFSIDNLCKELRSL